MTANSKTVGFIFMSIHDKSLSVLFMITIYTITGNLEFNNLNPNNSLYTASMLQSWFYN